MSFYGLKKITLFLGVVNASVLSLLALLMSMGEDGAYIFLEHLDFIIIIGIPTLFVASVSHVVFFFKLINREKEIDERIEEKMSVAEKFFEYILFFGSIILFIIILTAGK